ncbi:MAG: cold shock domain-containing protein [Thermodesulfobacteriota bacterium]
MSERLSGKVKFFSGAGRYGFITTDDGKEIYFQERDCHSSISHLNPDDRVEFQTIPAMKGPRAINIKLLSNIDGERN